MPYENAFSYHHLSWLRAELLSRQRAGRVCRRAGGGGWAAGAQEGDQGAVSESAGRLRDARRRGGHPLRRQGEAVANPAPELLPQVVRRKTKGAAAAAADAVYRVGVFAARVR